MMVEDKVIVVTGGGSGIGLTTCHTLASNGATVVVADLNLAAAQAVAEEIRAAGYKADACEANVAVESSVKDMVGFAVRKFGRLDGAHNNAGIEMSNKPIYELENDEWQNVLKVDLSGVFYCLKHEILAVKETGGGAIVNTSSGSGIRGHANSSDYVAAKHGVQGLTKAAAIDAAGFGIRVNAVNPGFIMTPMARDRLMADPVFSKSLDALLARHHIGRFGETQEVANAVMWLLSDQSSFVTGSPILVDGGYAI